MKLDFIRRVSSSVSKLIVCAAVIDALLLVIFQGALFHQEFPASKDAIEFQLATLVIVISGFMFVLQMKSHGFGLLAVAVYVIAKEPILRSIISSFD